MNAQVHIMAGTGHATSSGKVLTVQSPQTSRTSKPFFKTITSHLEEQWTQKLGGIKLSDHNQPKAL